jgi:rare lipoprotein A
MENDDHSGEVRLPGLPEADVVRLKLQLRQVETAPRLRGREVSDHVGHTSLRPGPWRVRTSLFLVLTCWLSTAFPAQEAASPDARKASPQAAHHAGLDRSGKTRKGKASYYGRKFYSRKMADGTRMNPQSNAAASKTLPLGTKARVTNLENGNNEVVEIRDRGPYVKDRIVDVSPKTADKLGLKEGGTAPVEVKPIEVPQPDGSVKPGTRAAEPQRP